MTDEQVVAFVDRYIPGYVYFGDGVQLGDIATGKRPPWNGNGLQLVIDENREVVGSSEF